MVQFFFASQCICVIYSLLHLHLSHIAVDHLHHLHYHHFHFLLLVQSFILNFHSNIESVFTALHGMPARTSYEKGVCPSVRLSNAWIV